MRKPPGLNQKHSRIIMRLMSQIQTKIYRLSGGRFGSKFLHGAPVMLLTTIGRKSGQPRTTPVLYLRDGERVVCVASQAGRDDHPLWYLNLSAEPKVTVEIDGKAEQRIARTASDEERDQLWPKLNAMYPDFDSYQSWTERRIPVVILDPA